MRFLRNTEIDSIAEQRLAEYEQKYGAISPPVPIEKVVAQVYNLTLEWEEIEEAPGETILGGLNPEDRLIVINTRHLSVFEEKPGLERSTIGHEAGHWEFDVDKSAIGHPKLFDTHSVISHRRHAGLRLVEIFSGEACAAQFLEALRRKDTSDQERIANRFSAALSMPRSLLQNASKDFNLLFWPDLYRLAKLFEVNISAMTVRLQQLNLLYIDKEGRLHRSVEEAMGQRLLF